MKKFLILVVALVAIEAQASHWMTYYIYTEKEYVQGPWSRDALLQQSASRYLEPKAYEDLMGSEPEDFVHLLLKRLKQNNYEGYRWSYDLTLTGDIITIIPLEPIANLETVKNEITVTALLNNFEAVVFKRQFQTDTLALADVTVPFFDLVKPQTKVEQPQNIAEELALPPSIEKTLPTEKQPFGKQTSDEKVTGLNGSATNWLILLMGLNLLLLLVLLFRRKRRW